VLHYYLDLLALRRSTPALSTGEYREIGAGADVFAFERTHRDQRVIVLLNMANAPRNTVVDIEGEGHVLLGTNRPGGERVTFASLTLAPLEALVLAGGSTQ
jgi:alpha-glucosidase